MAEPASRPYVLISSDGHAGADLRDYRPYLERAFHEEFDAWVEDFSEPWAEYDKELVDTDDEFIRIGQASFLSPYNWDSDKRLEHLNDQGIAGEVVLPNTVPPFYPAAVISAWAPRNAEEYRLRQAGVKAHNRWLADFCGLAPERRAGLAQVFLNDIDETVAEVRWAHEHGLKGVLIPADHMCQLVNLFEPRLDPFWAVCQELGMPVHRHAIAVGVPESEEAGPAAAALGGHETYLFFQRGLGHLIFGGVFERFPELQFVFTETNCGWVERELFQLDVEAQMGSTKGGSAYPTHHRAVQALSLTAHEYFERNVHLGTSLMISHDVQARHTLGVDRLMWGADYPHHEGLFPHTRLGLRALFADVAEDEVRKMTSENAAALYGFDLDALQVVANEIGPTVEEVATPVAAAEFPEHTMSITLVEAKHRTSVPQ
ncbi:MAG TPA: amidohydrolase family protein [Acidimicrobiales bacterium]